MEPVRRPGLYVSLAVVLVFVLATYLASSIRGEDLPSVSVVQEPTVSQLPSGIALVGNVEDEERNAEDENKENQPEKQAESPAKDDEIKAEQSGQEEHALRRAQVPSSSATASASASAGASASATASASPDLPPRRPRTCANQGSARTGGRGTTRRRRHGCPGWSTCPRVRQSESSRDASGSRRRYPAWRRGSRQSEGSCRLRLWILLRRRVVSIYRHCYHCC